MDFDSTNYSADELLNILEIGKTGDYSLENVFKLTKKSMDITRLSDDNANKEHILDFIIGSFKRLCGHFQYDMPDYMTRELESIKIKLVSNSESVDPSNFVINSGMVNRQRANTRSRRMGVRNNTVVEKKKFKGVNPIKREIYNTALTINTKYRNNYYGTKSTDFLFTLPTPVNNVTALKISNTELQNTYYAVSNYLKTNVFYVVIRKGTSGTVDGKYKIEIPDGNYTNLEAVYAINGVSRVLSTRGSPATAGYGLKAGKLITSGNAATSGTDISSIVSVSYDTLSKKIIFSLIDATYEFDLDFILQGEVQRDISKNIGWLLGYQQPYYDFTDLYKQPSIMNGVSVKTEGFQPESLADFTGTKFFLLEVSDFNNNSIQSFYYPSSFNSVTLTDLLGKIPNNGLANILFEDSYGPTNPTRHYLGPVNIEKIGIRLLDDNGHVIDLNNFDFTITFELEVLNVHYDLLDQ